MDCGDDGEDMVGKLSRVLLSQVTFTSDKSHDVIFSASTTYARLSKHYAEGIPVAPGAGVVVGTVVGCKAVFHVAVFGYAVVAMGATVVP